MECLIVREMKVKLPKNHSVWLVFLHGKVVVWFENKEEAFKYLKDCKEAGVFNPSKAIKFTRDF